MRASSSPGETLAGPGKFWFVHGCTGVSRTSMICGASLLLRRIIIVRWEFGALLGSKMCMIQPSDHFKNPVGRDDFVSVGSFLFLEW